MAVKKFRFVSPGVFVNEIDNSQVPASPAGLGPVVIGRAPKGPGLRPVTVDSFSEFVEIFGSPIAGGAGGDVWRDGNSTGPTYGIYGAQAYLRNSSPLTYVRLLGAQSAAKASSGGPRNDGGIGGWKVSAANSTTSEGAYGLVIFASGANNTTVSTQATLTGALAAVFYVDRSTTNSSSLSLSGTLVGLSGTNALALSGTSVLLDAIGSTSDYEFKMVLANYQGTKDKTTAFNFNPDSPRYLRKVFNTNPQQSNEQTVEDPIKYWLGESFDRHLKNVVGSSATKYAALLPLVSGSNNGGNFQTPLQAAQTPWVISQDTSTDNSSFNPNTMQKLFRFVALNEPGEWTNKNLKISIENVKAPTNDFNTFGSFSVVIRRLADSDNVVQVVEQFDNCNLNRDSLNYIGRIIGDRYTSWDDTLRRYRTYNQYDNRSRYIRMDMNSLVDNGSLPDKRLLPFGFQGMVKYKDVSLSDTLGSTAATAVDAIDTTGLLADRYNDASFTISISTAAGGLGGTAVTFLLDASESTSGTGGANQIMIGTDDGITDAARAALIIKAINGDTDSKVNYATSGNGESGDDLGITAAEGSSDTQITLTMDIASAAGNITSALASVSGVDIIDVTAFTGGITSDAGYSPSILGLSSSAYGAGGTAHGLTSSYMTSGSYFGHGFTKLTASMALPAAIYRVSASDGGIGENTDAYFGFQVSREAGGTRFDESTGDLLNMVGGLTTNQFSVTTGTELGTAFTLDDLQFVGSGNYKNAAWVSGSRADGVSLTALSSSWQQVLDEGFDQFTLPLHGGFDGLDIREPEPFNNTDLAGTTEFNHYANYSIKRAIDSVADPERVEMNLAAVPGVWDESMTAHLINTCEDRADALAIIDLKGDFKAKTENTESFSSRVGSVSTTISNLRSRGLNSSYACAYYPWVQARDSINGALLWVPPSIVALGTFSSSQRRTQVWFAPAGFNRGGLSAGAAGIPVVNIVEQLTRSQRDDLYEANINPIAKFPAEGIVVFGQKTLQVTPSALDRINVRRLLIFVKKRISQMATRLLFEPNVQKTWDRFVGQVSPFLNEVRTNFGLSEYKLVLDETTTTPDLIDRNIMYAKIYLKPTRAIEFIALDFNITRTGASFDD